jgi:hypothetical protein
MIFFFIYIAKQDVKNEVSRRESKFNFSMGKNGSYSDRTDYVKWELVRRKSERWKELGFGDGEAFPGYGKLYQREFQVWYCDIGSKVKMDVQIHRDKNTIYYFPVNIHKIIGEGVYLYSLNNTMGFESLFTGLDNKNRKRWYFALIKFTPTGIETACALETEKDIEYKEIELKIDVPEGWNLVRRKSTEWFFNGFGEDDLFPGYGKIYERTFDVWYCKIGLKERISKPEFKDKAVLKFSNRICGDLGELKGKGGNFESLSKTQGYIGLLTFVDKKERKRWYFGLKKTEPTYIFTAPR